MDRKNLMPHQTQPAKPSATEEALPHQTQPVEQGSPNVSEEALGAQKLSEETLTGITGGGADEIPVSGGSGPLPGPLGVLEDVPLEDVPLFNEGP